jgi:hypothetical protein
VAEVLSGGHQVRIERGTVIADRYVVSAIEKQWLADAPDAGVVCLALDAILDDPVILYVADQELSGDLLDAGRRLSLVNDPRIPTVQDVGTSVIDDDLTIVYIACERTAATSLAEILASGPVGPAAARAVAGEVAEVLVHAGRRGLHHRCLGPESIGIMTNGDVVVHGIAIDASVSEVALGLEVQTDQTALREDALAIVDVLYACLSAQWPKPESRAGLPAAPRKNQRVVDIEQLRRDIPEDLTAFITGITSHSDPGPRSPGEIIRYLREWDRDTLADLEGSPLPDEALFAVDPDEPTQALEAGAAPSDDAPEAAPGPGTGAAAGVGSGVAAESANGTGSISTSAGAGAVGSKPTVNTQANAARPAATSTGMGTTSVAPTHPSPGSAPLHTPVQRQATPDQIQAALARIGMTRPGTSGFSAGRTDGVQTKLDERMQMREASVFPLSGSDLETVEAEEWTPEQTYSDYENLSAAEYDAEMTAPIMDRDAMWGETEDVSTQQMPIIPDLSAAESEVADDADGTADDADSRDAGDAAATNGVAPGADGTGAAGAGAAGADEAAPADADASADDEWFLGGVFTTREEQIRQQREDFERERALEQRRAEAARRAVEESEARAARQREASKKEAARREGLDSAAAAGAAGGATATGAAATEGTTASAAEPAAVEAAGGSAGTGSPQTGASGGRGPRERRRITVLVAAAVLVIAVIVIGFFALGGSSDEEPQVQPTEQPTAAPPEDDEAQEPEEPEGPAPEIAAVEAIDPEGDDEENSDQAELVLPGEDGGWQSERYNSPEFGGLKSGLGLMLELEEESQISVIDLQAPDGEVQLEIRVGDSDDVEDAETVATEEIDGDATIELDEAATGQYVFLWYTQAAPEGDGYRVMVDEVELS